MTSAVGLTRDERHRYYWQGQGPIPSVTTITGAAIAKPGLVGWARRETALYAVRNHDLLERMIADFGAEQTAATVKTVTDKEAKDKASLGTRVHALAEAVLREQPIEMAPDEAPFIASLRTFLDDWTPTWLAAEEMVCSLEHGYAGTLDAIGHFDGAVTLLDIKTGGDLGRSGVYDEFALQLAAYARAGFIGRVGVPRKFRIPDVERFVILHLRPEGYQLIPFDVQESDFQAFLACRRLYAWTVERAPKVKGQPMEKRRVA